MRITRLNSQLLRLPLPRPAAQALPLGGSGRLDHTFLLLVTLDTDAGLSGLGFAYSTQGGGRALRALADDDLAPLVVGEDPLDHERLFAKCGVRLQSIGRRGLVMQAYSAVDLALWDLKGKAAGLPLYKLLGGARDAAPVYGSDTGWLWMKGEEIIEASRPYIEQGVMGVKLKVGNANPEVDAQRVQQVREAFGEDVWLAVDANQRYTYGTALAMGHFFEDEMGIDWFEEPLSCEDVEGHARLADKLEIPIALGETLFAADEFQSYVRHGAADVLQPDVTRLGGLTPTLKVAALAELHHRPLAPHLMPEVAVHLACGRNNVLAGEWMPWFFPAFVEVPALVKGRAVPPDRPGLGLEVSPDAVAKYGLE